MPHESAEVREKRTPSQSSDAGGNGKPQRCLEVDTAAEPQSKSLWSAAALG